MSTAILLTCYNRKKITLRCLTALTQIRKNFDIYLVDDNSTDGTFDAVKKLFPEVNLIKGTGNLFWNRGMHLAWSVASEKNYDFYIWLNDDVLIHEDSFDEIFECSTLQNHKSIISGIVLNKKTNEVIYGGRDQAKKLLQPNGKLNSITYLNGNFVLVPRYVYKILGNLDPVFHHDIGDVDYGLRAKQEGIKVLTTRKAVAHGEANKIKRFRKDNTTLINRFKHLYSPLGSNPNINFYFRKKHYGILNALLFYVFLHILAVLPDFVAHILFKDKY